MDGLLDACRTIWREDGIKGFYRGCATNLLRTTPAAALTFTSFELIARCVCGAAAPGGCCACAWGALGLPGQPGLGTAGLEAGGWSPGLLLGQAVPAWARACLPAVVAPLGPCSSLPGSCCCDSQPAQPAAPRRWRCC